MIGDRARDALYRKIKLAIGRFVVTAINTAGADALGRVTSTRLDGTVYAGERELADVRHVEPYGFATHPIPGAEGIVLAVGGSRTRAIVINCEDPRHRPIDLAEGEVEIYNAAGARVRLLADGSIEIEGGDITATGDAITIDGSSSVTIGDNVTIDGKVFLTHTHDDVQTGTGTSGPVT